MLIRRPILEAVARGDVTLAFRRWQKPTVRANGRLRTAMGSLRMGSVTEIEPTSITDADAKAAGYRDRKEAISDLADRPDGNVYRIELVGLETDERVALRENPDISPEDLASLRAIFLRWQKQKPGHFLAILREVSDGPGTAATVLAAGLGLATQAFKRDIRKLKELGLTESLETGYRISPRGEAFLRSGKITPEVDQSA